MLVPGGRLRSITKYAEKHWWTARSEDTDARGNGVGGSVKGGTRAYPATRASLSEGRQAPPRRVRLPGQGVRQVCI